MSQESFLQTTATGSDINFTITTFSSDEILVYVDGVKKTAGVHYNINPYNSNGQSTVDWTINNAPTSPSIVRIVRQTDVLNNGNTAVEGKATYQAGASVKADDLNNNQKQVLRALQEHNDQLIQTYDIEDGAVNSAKIKDASIVEGDLANSAVTSNKIADNAVTTTEILNGAVTSAKIADGTIVNADINASAAIAGTKINPAFGSQNITTSGTVDGRDVSADGAKLDTIQANATGDQSAAAIKTLLQSDKLTASEIATGALDGRYFTETESDARYFNISSGETIKDGDTFPDNDTTIATTAAINDRIIDLIDDVGGFDIIQSEQHFPNTNPQGTTGQSAVLSVKAASTNLVPSGTTVTISNGNLANNANIIITGVPSTIPTGFGFLVESTSTTHTYSFHRLVPKATEVTTVAGKATEIGRLGTAAAVEDMSILGTTDVVADMAILGTTDVVADLNTLGTADVVADMNTLAVTSVINNMDTVADNVANVNNVGTNIAKVNTVAASIGGTQTFTITVQNVSGSNYFFVDGQQSPTLTLARGFTYTFNVSDSSNSGHPLRFKDGSGNSYTTGVTVNGTQGQSGATVVIAVAANAPNSLRYYCTVHGNGMGNTITVTDDNIGIVAGSISNVNTVGGAITNVNNVGGSISNVNTVATNISNINDFSDKYRVGANNPTSSLDTGDLFFNTTSNSLKVYTGSSWVDGVTTTGNFALRSGNTFTGSNLHNDNVKSIYGTGSDLEIYHDGSNSYLENTTGHIVIKDTTDKIFLQSPEIVFEDDTTNETIAKFISDGAVELYYDNSKKFETTSSGVTVTGTLAATSYTGDGSNLSGINTDLVSDTSPQLGGDLQSNGNDIDFADDDKAIFGTGSDLSIRHSSSGNSLIDNTTGILYVRANDLRLADFASTKTYLKGISNGAVELYHNNSKKFETTSTGATVTDNFSITDTAGSQRLLMGNQDSAGTDCPKILNSGNGTLKIGIGNSWSGDGGTLTEQLNITKDGNVQIPNDSGKLQLGASQDLQIYHDGTNSYINDSGTGVLRYLSNTHYFANSALSELQAQFIENGAVNLYYDGSKKLETTSGGATVTGNFTVNSSYGTSTLSHNLELSDAGRIKIGTGQDLQIFHSGTDSFIQNFTGDLNIRGVDGKWIIIQAKPNENSIICKEDGAVELYHDNNKKFETNSGGCTLTGTLTTTSGINAGNNVSLADGIKLKLGTSDDLLIHHTSNDNIINAQNGNLYIQRGGTTSLTFDGNGDLNLPDSRVLGFGNSADLQIFHNGSDSYIRTTTGSTYITPKTGENGIQLVPDGSVNLYYDNALRFNTDSYGTDFNDGYLHKYTSSGNSVELRFHSSDGTRRGSVYADNGNTVGFLTPAGGWSARWSATHHTSHVHINPNSNDTYDLGSSGYRWRNIYTNDLNLSNEGGANDVDGSWGNWTIQEGESDLFLKNNRSGKKYKFNLTEVS